MGKGDKGNTNQLEIDLGMSKERLVDNKIRKQNKGVQKNLVGRKKMFVKLQCTKSVEELLVYRKEEREREELL